MLRTTDEPNPFKPPVPQDDPNIKADYRLQPSAESQASACTPEQNAAPQGSNAESAEPTRQTGLGGPPKPVKVCDICKTVRAPFGKKRHWVDTREWSNCWDCHGLYKKCVWYCKEYKDGRYIKVWEKLTRTGELTSSGRSRTDRKACRRTS